MTGGAVHIASRVMAIAAPGEVLVSRALRDVVAGSDIELADRGIHQLKGVPGEFQLYAASPHSLYLTWILPGADESWPGRHAPTPTRRLSQEPWPAFSERTTLRGL